MDAECASGYAVLEGSEDHPLLPPTVILNDYLAGYLTAMGVVAALILRAQHGGSYHVRCSLTRFSMWYSQLGVFDPAYVKETIEKPDHKPILGRGISFTGAYGKQVHPEPGITFSKTPGHWNVAGHSVVAPRGSSDPERIVSLGLSAVNHTCAGLNAMPQPCRGVNCRRNGGKG